MIPLIQEEVVEAQRWLSQDEFLDAYALGNTLPGPIATKLAGYVGYKVAGPLGATFGIVGLVLPTAIAMILLLGVYLRFRDTPQVTGFLQGIRPVVIALLALVVWEFAPRAFGMPTQWAANWALWAIALVAFALSVRFNVHPGILIVVAGTIGAIFLKG